jgi:hypothetical protein
MNDEPESPVHTSSFIYHLSERALRFGGGLFLCAIRSGVVKESV